jgi:hypothetical protein
MDGAKAKLPTLPAVQRHFEPHRLKEQIMAQAYQFLLPVVSQNLNPPPRAGTTFQPRHAAGAQP